MLFWLTLATYISRLSSLAAADFLDLAVDLVVILALGVGDLAEGRGDEISSRDSTSFSGMR